MDTFKPSKRIKNLHRKHFEKMSLKMFARKMAFSSYYGFDAAHEWLDLKSGNRLALPPCPTT